MERIIVEDSIKGFVVDIESPDPTAFGPIVDVAYYRFRKPADTLRDKLRKAGLIAETTEAYFPESTRFQDDGGSK